jgi:choline dehydrogenase-like flavoprotein
MIRDFATFDGDQPLTCDLCIAGAGAAGISIALEFARRGERVVLLESGGLDFEEATQELYVGDNLGHPYFDLETTRVRFFGGSTNHWGGMCAPLDPLDFEQRDWVPYSGWPITAADLEPYYARAHPLLELGPYNYDAAEIAPPGTEFLTFRPDRIRPKMWRYSTPPTNFGSAYREPLAQIGNVDVLLHANLVEIETGPAGSSVSAFRIQTLDGKAARVQARAYVLALGAIENPRLLLSSDRVVAGGLGNQHDLVGRFFMEHARIGAGSVLSTKENWEQAYVDLFRDGHQVRCGLTASPEVQAREGILNPMLMLGDKTVGRERSAGYSSLSHIKSALANGEIPADLGGHLLNILGDLGGVVRGVYERADSTVYVMMAAEQAPNPDSRVVLGQERDRLGMRRANLDWRLSALDKRSARTLVELVGQEIARLEVGRLQMADWLAQDDDAWSDDVDGHYHHMGTTRMASDPSRGVVDADCRVFGVANLYVAGSSVFPTGGCTNPTLSLTALALRLADHLQTLLA